ncbi:MAG: tetratricopeptide repeat protein [Candidatus Azambacteria bacterium]|nr:tetratricopeptide repeat protein [Candidatus Azambacteria bacterium]
MAKKKINNLSKIPPKIFAENFWAIWFLVAVFLILVFTAKQDSLARFAWQNRWLKMAILLDRSDVDLAMFIGNYYFNGVFGGGEYNPDVALKAYEKAVRVNPKILWGHYQLARIYFVKGNYDKALSEINLEFEANPENLRSLYVRGLIYGYRAVSGDLGKAEEDFQRFTKWAPREWAGYNDFAWVLSKQGKYSEAEKTISLAFKEALDAKNNPWLWNALGVAQLNLKKYSNATDSFKKAKELAEKLTINDWARAYPGNNPSTGGEGLSAFLKAISENLRRAESKK